MKNSLYRNASGCYDPTAGEAISHIVREERRERKKLPSRTKQNQQKQTEKAKIDIETEVNVDECNGI